jgi:hypothetical protein
LRENGTSCIFFDGSSNHCYSSVSFDVAVVTVFHVTSITVASCLLWNKWRSEHRLVLSYVSAGDAAEKQLVKASFRITNCFASCSSVHAVLERVCVSAKILHKNKITVKFLNPLKSFANHNDKCVHSWIDPDMFDLYTVMLNLQSSRDTEHCRLWMWWQSK